MNESEIYLDREVRKNINKLYNILYIECKDKYGGFDDKLFERLSKCLKEKVSTHIDSVIDTYTKL